MNFKISNRHAGCGLVLFLLGYLFYGMALASFQPSFCGSARKHAIHERNCVVGPHSGQYFLGCITHLCFAEADVNSFSSGARTGAVSFLWH